MTCIRRLVTITPDIAVVTAESVVEHFIRAAAKEFARRGISVTAVCQDTHTASAQDSSTLVPER